MGDLTRSVRGILESALGEVVVQGEICNFRRQASGHCYFGLKDERALLSCVLFRSSAPGSLELADGMLVQARGRVTVYEARGQYQLNVSHVEPAGAGALQARFEALKRRLAAEGLFDTARKRPLPPEPRCVGLVTSPTGAAIRDFINVARRRAPWVRLVVNPARVQGVGAAAEIALAIREFNGPFFAPGEIELIVLCRGGGSMEDLWAFNEEAVARAIAESRLPVVSAVGHEIDFTIADFVADLRAPTPSAAAELVLPDRAALARHLGQARLRLMRALETCVVLKRRHLDLLSRADVFRAPRRILQERAQRLDSAAAALEANGARLLRERRERLLGLQAFIRQHRPDQVVALRRMGVAGLRSRMEAAFQSALAARKERIDQLQQVLRVLSPQATLARGYAMALDARGRILRDAAGANPGDTVTLKLARGELKAEVKGE